MAGRHVEGSELKNGAVRDKFSAGLSGALLVKILTDILYLLVFGELVRELRRESYRVVRLELCGMHVS